MRIRRALTGSIVLLLAVFGWYAMVPVWTQGLGSVAIGPDGQPALWMTAVGMGWLVVLAAMGGCLAFWPKAGKSGRPGFGRSRAMGTCALVTVMILYLAMAGQPLRLWFLLESAVWNGQFAAGGAALLASGVFFLAAGKLGRAVAALLALVSAGTAAGIITPFYAGTAFPACIDWAVLAFALSCGAFVAWTTRDATSQAIQAEQRAKDF